jgi:anaerobic magnesium-protoporphyrin IX monomethyl ester cyclase
MGGTHFTFFPEHGLKDRFVDYVVQGPGEQIILDLVNNKFKDKFIKGHFPINVNDILFPDRSLIYKYDEFGKSPMKRFIAARYCLMNCAYCFSPMLRKLYTDESYTTFKQKTSPSRMVAEIKDVKEKYGLQLAYFNDDDIAFDKKWLYEFGDLLKKEVGISYCGSFRATSVNKEVLQFMKNTGGTFFNLALESANESTQKILNRGNINNERIKEAVSYCNELGIKTRIQNMIGLPVEDPLQDALDTLLLNQQLNPTDSWASIFQPFPKTAIFDYCLEKNLIKENISCYSYHDRSPLFIPKKQELIRLHKLWFFFVKYQVPTDLVKILITQPMTKKIQNEIWKLRLDVSKHLLYNL